MLLHNANAAFTSTILLVVLTACASRGSTNTTRENTTTDASVATANDSSAAREPDAASDAGRRHGRSEPADASRADGNPAHHQSDRHDAGSNPPPPADAGDVRSMDGSSDACPVEGCQTFLCAGTGRRLLRLPGAAIAIAAGDIDGDHLTDLVLAGGSHGLMVLLNQGDAGFAKPLEYDYRDPEVFSIAVADLNGDDKTDVALDTGYGPRLLLNDGHGGLGELGQLEAMGDSISAGVASIVIDDMNNDGLPDVVSANHAMLTNQGNGTFSGRDTLGGSSEVHSIAVADFDGNGWDDLATADPIDSVVHVLLNGPAGGVGSSDKQDSPRAQPESIVAANLNGDKKPDLAVGNFATGDIVVYVNNGDGTFAEAVTYPLSPGRSGTVQVIASDFDGDGAIDLAAINDSSFVSVLLNRGDATFEPTINYAAGMQPVSVVASDLDQDGRPDLAIANSNGDLNILLNQGGTFPSPAIYGSSVQPDSVTVADFNGDNMADVLSANVYMLPFPSFTLFVNRGDGSLQESSNEAQPVAALSLTAGDVNGDMKNDVAFINKNGNAGVALQQADGSFAISLSFDTGGSGAQAVVLGDLDHDHDLDVVVANAMSNDVSVLLGHGDGMFDSAVNYAAGTSPASLVLADLDGNSSLDVAVANSGSNDLTVRLNKGDGKLSDGASYAVQSPPTSVAAADLDGDGSTDLAVASLTTGEVTILLNDGKGAFADAHSYAAGTEPSSISAADMNGDGRIDLIVSTAGSYSLRFFENLGGGAFADPLVQSLGIDARLVASTSASNFATVADVDGDGRPDVVMANPDVNNVSVTLNRCR